MSLSILTDRIASERDVVMARARAHRLAMHLGIEPVDQTRIATAVSEIARNALIHGGGGRISFEIDTDSRPPFFEIEVADAGGGIRDLDSVISGRGKGRGLISARRLVERFVIDSPVNGGTVVRIGKALGQQADVATAGKLAQLRKTAKADGAADPVQTMQRQNDELLGALSEVRLRQDEMARLNQELEDTNRGVVALYAELEEKAEHLRRASDLKTRFLSNMSLEFRTPLSSILALTRLLLDQVDGTLQPEQQKQVGYIRKSAEDLLELINDLLDLAKVEAGRLVARPAEFFAADLLGGLRGIVRPLQTREGVQVVVEDPGKIPLLHTDEGKVVQILRNFISNALRFTSEGSITVSAAYHPDKDFVEFSVADTGIGIAAQDQDYIFQEFSQVDNPMQAETRGTGLGLPLSRRLAELLGGYIALESAVGIGSRFSLWIPRELPGAQVPAEPKSERRLLVIDDEDTFRYIIRQMLGEAGGLEIAEAKNGLEGIAIARSIKPQAIILDVLMPGLSGLDVLRTLKRDPELEAIPVLVLTSLPVNDRLRAELPGATAVLGKQDLSKEALGRFLGTTGLRVSP